ncbi:hypothetical protein BDN72DRAFT_857388 [Pluteus cervinus]|uniref:Uncharacterized protein n=1 Tax=Pluteus cervinus TaxID=181527 RepID=A0ACD3AW94_9AGAR|nr:hypothetical protein BDN72DRAFT_857388 [Pluteus cervinus]
MPNVLVALQPVQSLGPPSPTYTSSSFDPLKDPYLAGTAASLMANSKPSILPLDGSKPVVSDPGPSSHNHQNNGFRAQLHHFLPKHTWFHVRLQIHQLANVPLISGEFGVKWRFKGVHAVPGTRRGILGMVKGKSRVTSAESQQLVSMGSVREDDASSEASPDSASVMASTNSDSGHGHALPLPTVPSVNVLDDINRNRNHPSSISQTSSTSSSDTKSLQDLSSSFSNTTITSTSSSSSSSRTAVASLPPGVEYAAARGSTNFVRLRDHDVIWEHTLDIIVRMDVERDTCDLLPNELKLVVMQKVIPDAIDAPRNPRFGALYLNLAEYASAGVVTRRYLLSESKTNATMKLTIQLQNVGGETNWKAPPLPKGEILTRVAGLLDSDVYRTRPRQLDLYGPYYSKEDLELDLDVKRVSGDSYREPTDSTVRGGECEEEEISSLQTDSMSSSMLSTVSTCTTGASGSGSVTTQFKPGSGFDVGKLPMAYGPKSTEALIEALFNPSLTTDRRNESPFTILTPPSAVGRGAAAGLGLGTGIGESHLEMLKEQHRRGAGLTADVVSLYSVASSEETSASGHSSSAKSAPLNQRLGPLQARSLPLSASMTQLHGEGRKAGLESRIQLHQHQQRQQQDGYLGVDDHGVLADRGFGVVPRSLTMGSTSSSSEEGGEGLLGDGMAGVGVKGWWKKVSSISRPSTPTPVR